MKLQNYNRRKFTSHLLGGVFTMGLSPNLFAHNLSILKEEIDWYKILNL